MTLFAEVVGHRSVLDVLDDEIAHPSQAYLFIGPGNVGKATVARLFAASLLCPDNTDGQRRVKLGVHPDLVLVEAEGRTAVTVDQARSTVAMASRAPIESQRKVFLFEEAGMMNDEAANALLKTLEEPTPSTVFILVAESDDELPPTVASRCRIVFFGRVTEQDIAAALVNRGLDQEQADDAARIAGGRPGLALSLATEPDVARFRAVWLSVPQRLTEQPGEAYRLADEVMAASDPLLAALKARHSAQVDEEPAVDRTMKDRQERELKRATNALWLTGLEILASWYRDAAAAQLGAPVRNHDVPKTALAGVPPAAAVAKAMRVMDTVESLNANQRPQLAFASLFADLGVES